MICSVAVAAAATTGEKGRPAATSKFARTITWSEPFNILTSNRLKLVTYSKYNELLLTIVAGIVRDYMQKRGINNPGAVHCLVPVDLTSNEYPAHLRQNSTFASVRMPVDVEGIVPRLWSTKHAVRSLKDSSAHLLIYFYTQLLFRLLPTRVAYALTRRVLNKHTLVGASLGAGCNAASLANASLCNHLVKSIVCVYPPICDIAVSFSIVTYGEEVRLAIVANPHVIAHPKLITAEFIRQVCIASNLIFLIYLFSFFALSLSLLVERSERPGRSSANTGRGEARRAAARGGQSVARRHEHQQSVRAAIGRQSQ